MTDLTALAAALATHPHITGKRDIDVACAALGLSQNSPGRPGDDAAAIPDADGWQLMATEGFMNDFVAAAPWFAGWCAVMVNVSDILAMGGRPTAATNALWAPDAATAQEILRGMRDASETYGVPIVGGHTNLRTDQPQLAAAIWGRARALITSFDARPGDVLIAATDQRGAYAGDSDNFPAFLNTPAARLRGDMDLLPTLAEDGLATAGKDISQGGIAGTALMLAECSGVGIRITPGDITPPDGDLTRWMTAFPSFGFLLTARPENADTVLHRFQARDIGAAVIGSVTAGSTLSLSDGATHHVVWDHAAHPYLGLGPEKKETAVA
ncbi:sll0787 family AIR synthase-like protein [Puniceibacterium sp. IMCC21224]|uniref:sll0787 family AIR synthase-like protein n=1 Tax=Puniceibacterium sp. IMCC21224 TaxID=1618204 RepID=UPI00064DE9F3|nr:sll0787 family AIR synthase-like protein [Puniceibacterium sp. IMCC21224]KMK66691.1 AIR synthase-related protein, sll0787 family [Puniceibacterium sp. IMCC21224]